MKETKKEIQFPCRWEFRLFAAMETLDKTNIQLTQINIITLVLLIDKLLQ